MKKIEKASDSNIMAFLQALGLSKDLASFQGRKRVQKVVYLLKQFGADLTFGYGWYIHGPYSPELTRSLFSKPQNSLKPFRELSKQELESVNRLRNFLSEDFYSVDSLELIVSLIYLIRHGPSRGLSTKKQITEYLRRQKPQFSEEQITGAWWKIEARGIWSADLAKLQKE